MYYFLALIIIFFDQLTKNLVFFGLPTGGQIDIFSWLSIVRVFNRGVSFSMFSSHSEIMPLILTILTSFISIGIAYWLYREKNSLLKLGLAFVLGGAIGNITDRIRLSAVIDFIDVHVGVYHWPAFNIADSMICLGAALIFYDTFFKARKKRKEEK